MPNLKSIKRKIASIKNTRQITKAMKMVAGAKFKKNQAAMNALRPYSEIYGGVIKNISRNTVLYNHPFFKKNSGNSVAGIIIISTDRGLCGSFNMNLFKLFFEELKARGLDGRRIKLYILGKKGADFFKRHNYSVEFTANFSENNITENLSETLAVKISADFINEKAGELYIISNNYISTLHQRAAIEKILPFNSSFESKDSGGYLVEPVSYEDEIIDKIFKNYIQTKIYFKIVESFAGEQASRMNAMDNATRNAGKLINKLTIAYNKARQAAVTLEILDIINGVSALK
ncbi:MAG: ATP synthase F1 subunit gamma [Deltaproteobacteria bacterium]|jgi:F-type H+-transporting ATPase subunit gamma|nr:ATP synthase F1 subunit gamma [Deltaproteobacteria bacterium]MCL5879621.1 ATP synthase F1 subunit gamma [Deltaproteobacteria bacterium]MDA8305024.1 ATP synthase F1 subunit gamma [Deltaproteobacteria bacterium]